jgi:hypothetical protein
LAFAQPSFVFPSQDETPDGERQGLTIFEFGEAGGPGMGESAFCCAKTAAAPVCFLHSDERFVLCYAANLYICPNRPHMQDRLLAMTSVCCVNCAGGCPGSPDQLSAPSGSFAAKKDGATVTFSWEKPEAAADASAVAGYYMAAMEQPAADTPLQRVSSARTR